MATTYGPFESGAGYTSTTEAEWRYWMAIASSGVVRSQDAAWDMNELEVYADSTGMQVKVRTGRAFHGGHWFKNDAEVTLAITAADPANPRIDLVVCRFDFASNVVGLAVKEGAPGVTPAVPGLNEGATQWEIPLAEVRVEAAASTIAADKVTDRRVFAGGSNQTCITVGRLGSVFPVGTASLTAIRFDTRSAGAASMWVPSDAAEETRVVIREAGVYVATGQVVFAANANGERRLQIMRNGSDVLGQWRDRANTAMSAPHDAQVVMVPTEMARGDKLQLLAYQDTGAALAVTARFGVWRLGAA